MLFPHLVVGPIEIHRRLFTGYSILQQESEIPVAGTSVYFASVEMITIGATCRQTQGVLNTVEKLMSYQAKAFTV
ncbi:hypothetical protein A4D02_17425 [Niastella koreensis]|uniref:Uncharacterized protein n=1 Tax=Niastella koreensis TaxID=354356 RepID=A0ABX3NLP4_9BACT|nr:hypothetical protein A4D02_17425 [Niastella koreensis]